MRKYLGSILLCLFLLSPSGLSAEGRPNITNSISLGPEFLFASISPSGIGMFWGSKIGVETNFGNPYLSLLNGLHIGGGVGAGELFSPSKGQFYTYYDIGMRIYLGIPYVFVDMGLNLGVGVEIDLSGHYQSSDFLASGEILLGFNIPCSESINLQISVGYNIGYTLMSFASGLGLQFKL